MESNQELKDDNLRQKSITSFETGGPTERIVSQIF